MYQRCYQITNNIYGNPKSESEFESLLETERKTQNVEMLYRARLELGNLIVTVELKGFRSNK